MLHNLLERPLDGTKNGWHMDWYKRFVTEYLKKLHDTVEILETLRAELSQLSQESHAKFFFVFQANVIRRSYKTLYIPYSLFNYSLFITGINYGSLHTSIKFISDNG